MAKTELFNTRTFAAEIDRRISLLLEYNTENLRSIRKEFSKTIAKAPPEAVLELALELLGRPGDFYRFIAYELVHHHRATLNSLGAKDLERLGRGIDCWGAVDMFACYLSGPVWREEQVSDKLIKDWARSKDRWWRRAALVSTVPLNNRARGGKGDSFRTLQICKLLVGDRDDMVVKALSWSLRELAKRDPESVKEFINQNSSSLAGRIMREVHNKLTTGLKNPGKL